MLFQFNAVHSEFIRCMFLCSENALNQTRRPPLSCYWTARYRSNEQYSYSSGRRGVCAPRSKSEAIYVEPIKCACISASCWTKSQQVTREIAFLAYRKGMGISKIEMNPSTLVAQSTPSLWYTVCHVISMFLEKEASRERGISLGVTKSGNDAAKTLRRKVLAAIALAE